MECVIKSSASAFKPHSKIWIHREFYTNDNVLIEQNLWVSVSGGQSFEFWNLTVYHNKCWFKFQFPYNKSGNLILTFISMETYFGLADRMRLQQTVNGKMCANKFDKVHPGICIFNWNLILATAAFNSSNKNGKYWKCLYRIHSAVLLFKVQIDSDAQRNI